MSDPVKKAHNCALSLPRSAGRCRGRTGPGPRRRDRRGPDPRRSEREHRKRRPVAGAGRRRRRPQPYLRRHTSCASRGEPAHVGGSWAIPGGWRPFLEEDGRCGRLGLLPAGGPCQRPARARRAGRGRARRSVLAGACGSPEGLGWETSFTPARGACSFSLIPSRERRV